MNTPSQKGRFRAFTLFEVIIVVAVILIMAVLFLPFHYDDRAEARRISCINNLKQGALAFRIWAGDHGDKFPMEVSTTDGGSLEFAGGTDTFRHFEVISNELMTPKVLFCPAESDSFRQRAETFASVRIPSAIPFTSNSNLSYFVGLGLSPTNTTMFLFLAGDHNLTVDTTIKPGVLEATMSWTNGMHKRQGNVAMANGSVQWYSTKTIMRQALASTGFATNRLSMP